MHFANKISTIVKSIIGLSVIIAVVAFSPQSLTSFHASACTWVTTSCGSGCSDNKDLYNCSSTVSITSVTPSTSNPDANAKSALVAPPVVQQYVPTTTVTPVPSAAAYITGTPGQTAASTTTYSAANIYVNNINGVTPIVSNPCLVSTGTGCVQYKTALPAAAAINSNTNKCLSGFWCAQGATTNAGCYISAVCTCGELTTNQCGSNEYSLGVVNPGWYNSPGAVNTCIAEYSVAEYTVNPSLKGMCKLHSASCTGTVCTSGSASSQATVCYCPNGLDANGMCLQNCTLVGQISAGGSFDLASLAGGNTCGAIQVDFGTGAVGSDANGALTYTINSACTSAPVPATGVTIVSNPSPRATPSTPAPAVYACVSITKDIAAPKYGDSVTFTCGTMASATHYEFQYQVGTVSGTLAPLNATSNISKPLPVSHLGAYKAQCRPCTDSICAPWVENWTLTSCNMTTNPPKTCPAGFTCRTSSTVLGADGTCN